MMLDVTPVGIVWPLITLNHQVFRTYGSITVPISKNSFRMHWFGPEMILESDRKYWIIGMEGPNCNPLLASYLPTGNKVSNGFEAARRRNCCQLVQLMILIPEDVMDIASHVYMSKRCTLIQVIPLCKSFCCLLYAWAYPNAKENIGTLWSYERTN